HVADVHAVQPHRRSVRHSSDFRQVGAQPVFRPQKACPGHIKNPHRDHEKRHQHEQPHAQLRPGQLFALRHSSTAPFFVRSRLPYLHTRKRFKYGSLTASSSSGVPSKNILPSRSTANRVLNSSSSEPRPLGLWLFGKTRFVAV